jgi:hypothetical protein
LKTFHCATCGSLVFFENVQCLNNLTRGLGLADAYPFVLSAPVIEKLRFVWASMLP